MNILLWTAFGLITGIVAQLIDPHPYYGGWVGTIVLGILGALVGGFLGDLLFGVGVSGFNLSSFIVAVAGALIVMFLSRAFLREA